MALTYTTETGTGVSQVYDIHWESNLGLLDRSHVFVYMGEDYTQDTIPFTWVSDTQIECSAVGEFTIRRIVPRSTATNDYENGAILHDKNLDDSFAQALMVQEEITDGYLTTNTAVRFKGIVDMQGERIVNLGDASEKTDALNKNALDVQVELQKEINDYQTGRLDDLDSALVEGDLLYKRVIWTATQGQTDFVPTSKFGGIISLYINGINQISGEAYENIDGRMIRTVPLNVGDRVVALIGQEQEFVVPTHIDLTYTRYTFTAVGGETEVTLPVPFETIASLYINGIHQSYMYAFNYDKELQICTLASELTKGDEVTVYIGQDLVLYETAWGSIGGLLENQPDLINALLGKVDSSQVLTDVPANAKFTDTTYDAPQSVTYTYTDGVLTGATETYEDGDKVITYNYTDGILQTSISVYNAITETTTYTYLDGVLTGYGVVKS